MFLDSKIGFLLLLTHFLSALLVGIVFRFYPFSFKTFKETQRQKNKLFSKKNKGSFKEMEEKNIYPSSHSENKKRIRISELGSIMGEGIRNSISTLLLICGFLVFFCVLGTILDKIGITNWISSILQKLFIYLGFPLEVTKDIACRKF